MFMGDNYVAYCDSAHVHRSIFIVYEQEIFHYWPNNRALLVLA